MTITYKRKLGDLGEKLACDYLKKLNYVILDKNFNCKFGEIDIIAKDAKEIVFVEVKTRTSEDYGQPQEAVDCFKLRKMIKTVNYYVGTYNLNCDVRIDVIAIVLNYATRIAKLTYFKDAMAEY